MTTFKKGDIVICKKYEVKCKPVFSSDKGMRIENYIDDYFFNREAMVEQTYEECMEEHGLETEQPVEEKYKIRFLDNNMVFAWLKKDELIKKIRICITD